MLHNPSPLNCYEINSRVKNVFEALQALVTQDCSTTEFCRSRVTDLFLFGKKQGSIFGIIVLQPGLGGLVPRILIEDI